MTKTTADYERRTIEGLTETDKQLLKTNKYKNIRMGRVNDPLITIDLDYWIPDELHLLLRITDVLTRNLITAAASDEYTNMAGATKTSSMDRWSKSFLEQLKAVEYHCPYMILTKKYLVLFLWLVVTE